MSWLLWRQHRAHVYAMLGLLAALALVYALIAGPARDYLDHSGLATCLATPGQGCDDLVAAFRDRYGGVLDNLPWLNLAPVLAGLFLGAPLVAREYEQGTHRLVWTQELGRGRWLAGKLAAGAGIAVAGGLLAGALDWWVLGPYLDSGLVSVVAPNFFGLRGIVPAAYALFAFAVGAAAGAVLRRTLPAMAFTLGVFLLVRLPWEGQRWRLATPISQVAAQTSTAMLRHDWILRSGPVDAAGRPVTDRQISDLCGVLLTKQSYLDCLTRHGLHQVAVFEPASRFWYFQWVEATLFAGMAVVGATVAVTATLRRRR